LKPKEYPPKISETGRDPRNPRSKGLASQKIPKTEEKSLSCQDEGKYGLTTEARVGKMGLDCPSTIHAWPNPLPLKLGPASELKPKLPPVWGWLKVEKPKEKPTTNIDGDGPPIPFHICRGDPNPL